MAVGEKQEGKEEGNKVLRVAGDLWSCRATSRLGLLRSRGRRYLTVLVALVALAWLTLTFDSPITN